MDTGLATKRDLKEAEVRLAHEIELVRRDMVIRIGGIIVVATGILLAATFLG